MNLIPALRAKGRALSIAKLIPRKNPNSVAFQVFKTFLRAIRLAVCQLGDIIADEVKLLAPGESIVTLFFRLFTRGFLEACHSNHEKLVDIRAHDSEKTKTFRQRCPLV